MASSSIIAQPRGLFGDEHHRTQSSSFDPFDSNPTNADNSLYTTANTSSSSAPMGPMFSQSSRPDSPQSSTTFDNHPSSSFHNASLQTNNDYYNPEPGPTFHSPIDERRQHQLFPNPYQTSTAFSARNRQQQQQPSQHQNVLVNGGGGILSHQSSAHTLASVYSSGDGLSPGGGPSASAFTSSDLYNGPLHIGSDMSMSGYSSNDGLSPYDSYEFVDRGQLRPSFSAPGNQSSLTSNSALRDGPGLLSSLNTTNNMHNNASNGINGGAGGLPSAIGMPGMGATISTPSTAVGPTLRDTLRDAREGPRDRDRDRERDRDLSVDTRRDGTGTAGPQGVGSGGGGGNGAGEEISTIFVVGFPDDMQVR